VPPAPPRPHRGPAPEHPRPARRGRGLLIVIGCVALAGALSMTLGLLHHSGRPDLAGATDPGTGQPARQGGSGPAAAARPGHGGAPAGWSPPLLVGNPKKGTYSLQGVACTQPTVCYTVDKAGN